MKWKESVTRISDSITWSLAGRGYKYKYPADIRTVVGSWIAFLCTIDRRALSGPVGIARTPTLTLSKTLICWISRWSCIGGSSRNFKSQADPWLFRTDNNSTVNQRDGKDASSNRLAGKFWRKLSLYGGCCDIKLWYVYVCACLCVTCVSVWMMEYGNFDLQHEL